MNPYYNQDFLSFLALFIKRVFTLEILNLQPDEIQIVVLSLVAISAVLTGSFLVLKKLTMLANSLSHTLLVGIAFVFWFSLGSGEPVSMWALMAASLGMAFITVGLTRFMIYSLDLKEDAATGLVFTTLFALGLVCVNLLTRSSHVGIEAVTGNVDALQLADVMPIFWITCLNALIFFLFYKSFKIISFDPLYAQFLGFSILIFDYLLLSLTALSLIASFRAVGVLMVLAFITAPVLSARFIMKRLSHLIFYALFLGLVTSFLSVALSRHLLTVHSLSVSTAGLTVILLTIVFVLHAFYWLVRPFKKAVEYN